MYGRFENLMTIAQFAEMALLDPWHVAGFCVGDGSNCDCRDRVYPEFPYQAKTLSRAEIAQAIAQAEQMIAAELGYWPAPKAFEAEAHAYPQGQRNRVFSSSPRPYHAPTMITTDGKAFKSITTKWARIQGVGKHVETNLGDAAITLNEAKTRFTATLDYEGTIPTDAELYLVIREEDRIDNAVADWRIFTDAITQSGEGTITITATGAAYHLMQPSLKDGRRWQCVDPDDNDSYVTQVTVMQRVLDTTDQGTLQWGTRPCTTGACNDVLTRDACMERDDMPNLGVLRPQPKEYNASSEAWETYNVTIVPKWVTVNYISGVPLQNGRVDQRYAFPIFYLAAALLETDAATCGCANAEDRLKKYRDVAKTRLQMLDEGQRISGFEERVLATQKHLNCPWGARLGAVLAWNMIQSLQHNLD